MHFQIALLLAATMPLIAVTAALSVWIFHSLGRVVRGLNEPALYEAVATAEIPTNSRVYLDAQTTRLVAAGFRVTADFRVRRELPHFARLFLDASGTIAAEVATMQSWPWRSIRATSLFSLLDTVICVETGNLAIPPHDGPLVVRGLRGAGPAELLSAHRRLLKDAQLATAAVPVPLDASSLPLVAVFAAALMHEQMAESHPGMVSAYADKLPQIRAAVEELVPQPAGV